MIRRSDDEGMETVTSMFLLIISALLIFGALSYIRSGGDDTNDGGLVELRSFQAKCLGEAIVRTYTVSLQDMDDGMGIPDAIMVWDGEVRDVLYQEFSSVPPSWSQALSTTPEGLTSALVVGDEFLLSFKPEGEFVTWSLTVRDGTLFRVYLSLHVGSICLKGDLE